MNVNALVMKEINTNLVRKTLQTKREATKHQIAEATGLSTVTVGTILQTLIDKNMVFDAGLADSRGGRPAQLFRFNENYAHALILFTHEENGLDMLYVRVADLNGDCVYEYNTPLTDITLHTFEPYIDAALEKYSSIRVIGFGLPGIEIDGEIVLLDYPALVGTPFIKHYQDRYQLPVIVENDVNAAGLGYCRRHQMESKGAIVYLYFPQKYQPGGGICIDGQLYKGTSNYAGEVAGMPLGIDWGDPALYTSRERICEAIATLIRGISYLLNPHRVILYGKFLTDLHLADIQQRCDALLPAPSIPQLHLAADFTLDYQTGIIAETLELLAPQISLSL